MVKNINTVSFFSGCGGLDLGFKAAEFKILFASDIMPEACNTLRLNFNDSIIWGPPTASGDISDLQATEIKKHLKNKSVDMLIGGPPCQPFSVAAAQRFLKSDLRFKRKGFDCNDKGQLIFEYLRLIKDLNPKAFLIENVPGLLKIDKGKTVTDLRSILKELGYKTNVAILDAADFGVPQNRKRAFIVGNRLNVDFVFPVGKYGFNLLSAQPYNTVCQALIDIPKTTTNNETRIHKEESTNRYTKLAPGVREMLGRVDRLNPLKPSKTVIAGGSKGGGRSHLHPFVARTLSVRESARLQTFPDNFIFEGKVARQFTQVGNAVPPVLAEVLAIEIRKQIFKFNTTKDSVSLLPEYSPQKIAFKKLLTSSIAQQEYQVYDDIKKVK